MAVAFYVSYSIIHEQKQGNDKTLLLSVKFVYAAAFISPTTCYILKHKHFIKIGLLGFEESFFIFCLDSYIVWQAVCQ